jgi:hypothetical protein
MGLGGQDLASPTLPRRIPGTHCRVEELGPRAGLDYSGKSCPTGIRSSDHPNRSQSHSGL